MVTDIDKLHKTLEEIENNPCHTGKTYAKCHIIAGYVELGMENIYIVIKQFGDVQYVTNMLGKVFMEHDLCLNTQQIPTVIKSGKSRLRLIINSNDMPERLRGTGGGILVHVADNN